jgi:hypothetical protein
VVHHALWRHNAGGAGSAAPKREAGNDVHARLAEISAALAAAGVSCPLEQATLLAYEEVALFLSKGAGHSGVTSAESAVKQALRCRAGGAAGAAPVMETPAKLAPPPPRRAGVKLEDDDDGEAH